MKRLILVIGVVLLSLAAQRHSFAGSATWSLSPATGDWNAAANWMPNTVPNGSGDVATFGLSDISNISINTTSVDVCNLVFESGADPFTITIDSGNGIVNLDITGSGIVNDSGVVQSFNGGEQTGIFFTDGTAGNLTSFNANGGLISFAGSATAATARFVVDNIGSFPGHLFFFNTSTAADATITVTNFGDVSFGDVATAGNAVFTAITGGSVLFGTNSSAANAVATCSAAPGTVGSEIGFTETATAALGSFTANGANANSDAGGLINFSDSTTAASASFVINGGTAQDAAGAVMTFFESATVGGATITVNGGSGGGHGGSLVLNGQSSGGTASLALFGNGQMDMSGHGHKQLTLGSIAGDGPIFLGAQSLAVGSNNASTSYTGVIQDGGSFGGTGGSLTKVGTGTLTLSGASTYTGATTVSAGVLKVANRTGSAAGAGAVNVYAGTLGGTGIVADATTVGTGSGVGAFLAPATGTKKQATLTIQSGLTFNSDATYTCTFKAKRNKSKTDKVIANGVTINSGATFNLSGTAQGTLTPGTVLTVIKNTAATPINGAFSNLPDGAIVTVNGNNLQAGYQGGDGNDLTLTVVP